MPKQHGVNRLSRGSIGNVTYVNHPMYGMLARGRYGPSKEIINTNPNYAPQKRNYQLLGATSRSCSLIRQGFKDAINCAADRTVNTRLVSIGRRIYETGLIYDQCHPYHTPAIRELKGFQFNERTSIQALFTGAVKLKRLEDRVQILIPDTQQLDYPNTTHYRIACTLASYDFEGHIFDTYDAGSERMSIDSVAGHKIECFFPEKYPVHILVVGLIFYQEVNGRSYALTNYNYAGADIMDVFLAGEQ